MRFGSDVGLLPDWVQQGFQGAEGMARADAADACVQSDSIKGLAQSLAKPAYHRLLIAEPALRRAVPTLIIAFLITICLGAFVQVVDQTRQKRLGIPRDISALAAPPPARIRPPPPPSPTLSPASPPRDRSGVKTSRACRRCCPISFHPGAPPRAATSSSPRPK